MKNRPASMKIEYYLDKLGAGFRELTRHYKSQEWSASAIPEQSRGEKRANWKPKQIMVSGKTPQDALEKLCLKVFGSYEAVIDHEPPKSTQKNIKLGKKK